MEKSEEIYIAASLSHDALVKTKKPIPYRDYKNNITWYADHTDPKVEFMNFRELEQAGFTSPLSGCCNKLRLISGKLQLINGGLRLINGKYEIIECFSGLQELNNNPY